MSRLHETNVKLKTGKTNDKCLNKMNVELRKRLSRLNETNVEVEKWSRVGAVVRALASHQCGPGSNPGPGVICGLSLLLVLALL